MSTSSPSAALVPASPIFGNAERLALAGFLAGYNGLTRQACELDLHQYAQLVPSAPRPAVQCRRADIECLARDLGARGRARATITWRLSTIAGFCRRAGTPDTIAEERGAGLIDIRCAGVSSS